MKQRPRRLGIVLTLVVVAGLLAGFLAFRKPTADLPEPSEASVSIDDADIALYEDYWCGSYTALDLSSSIPEQNTAIRFPVEVPPNTTLTNATLRFVAAKTVEDFKGSGFVIRGVFNASPWLVSDVCDDSQAAARDYRSRARTETSVSYQPSEWQRDKPYPIDVTAIVQEVINSPSWTGGAIAFAIEKFPDALVDITAYSSESSGNDPNKQTTLALYYAISSALKTVEASQ